MKYYKLLLAAFLMLGVACSSDDDAPVTPDVSLTASEAALFQKIQLMEAEMQEVYPEYDMTSIPAYIITEDPEPKGYLLNSPVNPEEAYRITSIPGNMVIYRHDEYLDKIEEDFFDLQFFDFFVELEGTEHLVMRPHRTSSPYNDYKNVDNNFFPLVFTHELFHIYQINNWNMPGPASLEFTKTAEFFALNLLLHDLMVEAYDITDPQEMKTYLAYYAGLRLEMMKQDQLTAGFVQNMLLTGELVEGTARYIEVFAAESTIYPNINDDPTHSLGNMLASVSNPGELENSLIFRPRYHIGAIVTHFLISLGVDVDPGFRQGLTPYALTLAYLNLTGEELASAAGQAKMQVDYEAYLDRGEEFMLFY